MNRINKFYKFTMVLVGFLMLVILFSCSSQEGRDKKALTKKIDPELVKISLNLACIDFNTSLNVDYYCKIASINDNALKNMPSSDKPEYKYIDEYFRQKMKKEKTQTEVLCDVLKKAQIHTSKIVNIALEAKKVPSNCYLFAAFVEKDTESDDSVVESIPLLFETLKDCKIAEEVLRNCDIGTSKCRQWQSSESFKSEEFFKKLIMQKKGNK